MKRLLVMFSTVLFGLAGVFSVAQTQSQAGGLPDISARVQVLETITTALQTQVTAVQTK